MLVARTCKMRMTAHDQSSRTSHLVQYSMKTYAAVTAELHAIFKFGAWLTVSSRSAPGDTTPIGIHYTR